MEAPSPPASQPVFSAAPHRMMFFGGALQLVAVLAFWLTEIISRHTPWWPPLDTALPAAFAHGYLMLYGLFPFFIFGFLMTTYPRWMNGELVPRRSYMLTFWLLAGGMALFYVGLFSARALAAGGAAVHLAGWGVGLRALLRVYRTAPAADKMYETVLNIALSAGWLGAFSYFLWLAGGYAWCLDFARTAGLWLFMVPLVVTVAHRMIPFFSSCVLSDYPVVQPRWNLPLLGACVAGHAALELLGARQWLWLFDLPLAAMGLYLTAHWGFRRSFEIRLLAVLHIAFLWFGLGMALHTVQSLALLFGAPILGKAPLHALGIGFLSAMVIAMVSRVTLGHSGRPLVLDGLSWACFLGIEAAALLRIATEFPGFGPGWSLAAAGAWLVCMSVWVLRHAPMYLRPRVDGQPG